MSVSSAMAQRRDEPEHAPISTYLEDRTGSRLPRRLATQSTHPPLNLDLTPRPAVGTSMLLSGGSSLAALKSAANASSALSVSSAMGERAFGPPRILEVDCHGALQVPHKHPPVFECPFYFLSCHLTFSTFSEWFIHSLHHFRGINPPNINNCCFCEQTFQDDNGIKSWKAKMEHLALHFQLGHKIPHVRPDFMLYEYLWKNRLVDNTLYKSLVGDRGSVIRTSAAAAAVYPVPPTYYRSDTPVVYPVTASYQRSRPRIQSESESRTGPPKPKEREQPDAVSIVYRSRRRTRALPMRKLN